MIDKGILLEELDVDDYASDLVMTQLLRLTPSQVRDILCTADRVETCKNIYLAIGKGEPLEIVGIGPVDFDEIAWPSILTQLRKAVELAFQRG